MYWKICIAGMPLLLLLTLHAPAQNVSITNKGLHIANDASIVIQGNASIVLNDASFINDGRFHADKSNIIFTGETNAVVGGICRTAFNNLVLQHQLQLESDIIVNGELIMNSGNLELNDYRLNLGSTGTITGEHIQSRITGEHGGVVTVTAVLNAPHNANPGNIGIALSSPHQGTFVITRGHVQQMNAGKKSIQRYYDVWPAINDLTINYFDAELAGNRKPGLVLWQLNNRYTMGAGNAAASAYPNPARDQFTFTCYSETSGKATLTLQDSKGHIVETKQIYLSKGINKQQWNISNYAAGTYYLVTGNTNIKIIKQ